MTKFGPLLRNLSRSACLTLAMAVVGAASMAYYHIGLFMPRVRYVAAEFHLAGEYSFGNDFYPIWLTSRRWIHQHLDPYSPALTREIQVGLFGRPLDPQHIPTDPPSEYRTFAYPAFTDLLFWPISVVPFHILRVAWCAVQLILLAATVVFWTRTLAWELSGIGLIIVGLLTICNYQELEGLYAGQLGLFVGFLLAASLLALMRGRPYIAGMCMALATIKPQMVLLVILYLIFWSVSDWRNRKGFSVAFFATMSALIVASLVVWPHWIQSWVSTIRGYPQYWMPPLASKILGDTLGSRIGGAVILALLIIAVAIAWRGRRATAGSYEFWLTFSSLVALTTITLVPGQSVCDHIIIIPAIYLLASCKQLRDEIKLFRVFFTICIGVVLWQWLAAIFVIVVRPFLTWDVFYSVAVFSLPLRTTAILPFVVIALLALAYRAAVAKREKTDDVFISVET
jgi:Glycosyltransferase family 87